MAQGDIYVIDIDLRNSSQTIIIGVPDSIVLSAIVSFKTVSTVNAGKWGELNLLNYNGEFMHRFFYKRNYTGQDWELVELPMKKLKLDGGDQLQFVAHCDDSRDSTYLNARITIMEV